MTVLPSEVGVLRYSAFAAGPLGGNPAGIVLDVDSLSDTEMLAVAADVGFSETAFATPIKDRALAVRYFSPEAEVSFCGHATIALAVAIAHRDGAGQLRLSTKAGQVSVETVVSATGQVVATLISVPPRSLGIPDDVVDELLRALRWPREDLDPSLPCLAAYAGAWHPVVAAGTRDRLTRLDYNENDLKELMNRFDWATVNLVWRESAHIFHSRNPFPPGGVWEDPATGAAAAALGGYLREQSLVSPPAKITVYQGEDMGRPSKISVAIPRGLSSGIEVSGTAVQIS